MEGFALAEYVVPRTGYEASVKFGTIPKAPNEAGSLFAEGKRNAKLPGPDTYHKDFLNRTWGDKAPGGGFSKLVRQGITDKSRKNSPAVGTYDCNTLQCSPRVRGGIMSKSARGCLFYDQAVSDAKWKPAPGKYNPKHQEPHLICPAWTSDSGASRMPKKAGLLGPGHYTPGYNQTEKTPIVYSGSKEESGSFLEQKANKDKTPAPGSNGIPDPKTLDRSGKQAHCRRLLADREVIPRQPHSAR